MAENPLLYENVFGKKRFLAKTKDTEKSITVTLASGKGVIITATAFDSSGADISKAYPGQAIGLYMTVRNDGDSDVVWGTVKDKDTGAIIVRKDGTKCEASTTLQAGKQVGWTMAAPTDLNMPNKTWNLLFEAGHGSA